MSKTCVSSAMHHRKYGPIVYLIFLQLCNIRIIRFVLLIVPFLTITGKLLQSQKKCFCYRSSNQHNVQFAHIESTTNNQTRTHQITVYFTKFHTIIHSYLFRSFRFIPLRLLGTLHTNVRNHTKWCKVIQS